MGLAVASGSEVLGGTVGVALTMGWGLLGWGYG